MIRVTLIAFVFVVVLGIAAWLEYTPPYSVGTCLQTNEREPWDARQIYRVEMVGNRNYLTRKTPASLVRDVEGIELSFETARHYHEVPCPQKEGTK